RGPARAQVAPEVQRPRPHALGGTALRTRTDAGPALHAQPHLPRPLGLGAVPVPLRAGAGTAGGAGADAGVVRDDGALAAGGRRSRRARPRGWAVVASESLWSERWQESFAWLEAVCSNLRARGGDYLTGQEFDGWDVRIRGGVLGRASLLMVVEEHGAGKQLV